MNEASPTMRYARALGWAAFAAAPILLCALALVSARPDAPPSIVTWAAIASWVAGTLAFSASLLHRGGRRGAARAAGIGAASIVVLSLALLVWSSSRPEERPVALDVRERAGLVPREAGGEPRLVHPHLGVSVPALASMEPAPDVARESETAGGPEWAGAHRVWAWRAEDTEIVLDLSRAPSASRRALSEATDAIAAQLGASLARRRDATHGAILESELSAGGWALARVALFEHGGRAYRLVATVVTRHPDAWRPWLAAIDVPAGA